MSRIQSSASARRVNADGRRAVPPTVALAAAVVAWSAAWLVAVPAAQAQTGDELSVVLAEKYADRFRLAFPNPSYDRALLGAHLEGAREIEQTLRDDLDLSGVFAVQGPTELSVLRITGDRANDFEQYRSLGNQIVLLADLKPEGDRLVLEGRLYDLPSGQSILGKRYRGTLDQARQLAHTFADDLVFQLTGRFGIARTTIAFHSTRDGYQELYLMDYDGRNQRRITGHQSTSGYPDWSPSGDTLAYVTYFTEAPSIHYVDMATGGKIEIYGKGGLNIAPSFSPDGAFVAFAHADGANVDVYVCPRACTAPQRLTTGNSIDTNPAWSPNGQQIAFTSDRSGSPQVYVMERDGGDVRRVTFDGNYNDGAAWRSDGIRLAYATRRGNVFRIAVSDLVSLQTVVLTDGPGSDESPTFSPDGRRIAFARKSGGSSQIWAMRADGTGLMQLTHEGQNYAPDWSSIPE